MGSGQCRDASSTAWSAHLGEQRSSIGLAPVPPTLDPRHNVDTGHSVPCFRSDERNPETERIRRRSDQHNTAQTGQMRTFIRAAPGHAKRMIENTNDGLSAIALACGFADQCHLTRIFSRLAGCSPGAWRRMRQG